MMIRKAVLLSVMLVSTLFPLAAQDTPQLVSIQTLEEILGDDFTAGAVRTAEMSPDGTKIVWWDVNVDSEEILCVYEFAADATNCYLLNVIYIGNTEPLHWSPDSTQIAFTEDVFRQYNDGDIWVLDIPSGIVTNRTEDNFYGSFIRAGTDAPDPLNIDHNPVWNPATGELYFLRTTRDASGEVPVTLYLYRLPAEGEPELVQNMSDIFPGLSIYSPIQAGFLDGAMAFSPDGSQLAMLALMREVGDTRNGIWVLDMNNPSQPPRQVYSGLIAGGLPAYFQSGMRATAITWAGDTIIAATTAESSIGVGINSNLYAINPSTGEVTPLVDFSSIQEARDLFTEEDALGYLPIFYAPRTGVVLGGDMLIALVGFEAEGGISIAHFPSDNPALTFVAPIPDFQHYPMYTSSVSSDGKVLLGGYLFTFAG